MLRILRFGRMWAYEDFLFLISFGSINNARTFIPRSNQLIIIVVLGGYYSTHQLVYTKVLSCCDINIWPVLQFWYWSGRFFYIIINIVDWYHAFTYIPVSNKQNDTNVRPEWNLQPSEFEKEEMSIGKRREEKRRESMWALKERLEGQSFMPLECTKRLQEKFYGIFWN